jgi:hypothetical protein
MMPAFRRRFGRVAWTIAALAGGSTLTACLLTSDFSGIVGTGALPEAGSTTSDDDASDDDASTDDAGVTTMMPPADSGSGDAGAHDADASPGDGDSGSRDAAPDHVDSGTTSPTDSGTSMDSGGTTGAGSYCLNQPEHTFCADFDEGVITTDSQPMSGPWSLPMTTGAIEQLDPTYFQSPTMGYRSTVPTSTGTAVVGGYLLGKAPAAANPVRRVHVAFDFYPHQCANANQAGIELATFSVRANATGQSIGAYGLAIAGTTYEVFEFVSPSNADAGSGQTILHALTDTLPNGQWTHVDMDFSLGLQNNWSASVTFNGNDVMPLKTLTPTTTDNAATAHIGGAGIGPVVNTCDVTYDNVFFDVYTAP